MAVALAVVAAAAAVCMPGAEAAFTQHVALKAPLHDAKSAARGVAQRLLGDDIANAYVPLSLVVD